jgi:hypothetical protein
MSAAFQSLAMELSRWAVIWALACVLFLLIELTKALWRRFGLRRM